jgi:sterol desaturase/sphingolipid hydroxylase (fatty acid hydroxylase superfamily)
MLNGLARHYYGYFIHADLHWTFGKFDIVLNSPAMHRWHHSREIHDKNFATLFSIWDRAFGTYYAPGPCDGPLGVDADMGMGVAGQYLYPFRAWWNGLRKAKTAVEIEP